MYIITLDPDSPEYLEHFGVLGMHWGVRNSETQRKYDGGQKHSEARTDIAKPTKGHAYKGEFKPSLSKDQTKMLKRAAAGVAIGAGIAAGVTIGAKTGVLKSVAKNGARKLASTKHLQQRGKEFAQSVRTKSGRNAVKRAAMRKGSDISKSAKQKAYGARAKARSSFNVRSAAIGSSINRSKAKIWNSQRMAPVRRLNNKVNYYTKDTKGKKKAGNRLALGAAGAAFLSAPIVEGREMDRHEIRRKNGRHASTKWMRNKERLS